MMRSTPNTALPEPSPAVVVTVTDSWAGAPATSGGVACSLAVTVTVVSQEPSAVCVSVMFMVASSYEPASMGPGIWVMLEV